MADHHNEPAAAVHRPDQGSETDVELPGANVAEQEKQFSSTDESGNETTETASLEKGGVVEAKGDAPPAAEEPEEQLTRQITGIRFFFVMAGILSSTFLFSLDNTVVADVQGIVATHFNAIDKLPWLSTGFALGAISVTLVWGKIYSQFDAKWLYVINVVLFELGSVLCAAAPNIDCLIVGRAIAGLGGMGVYIGVMTLIAYTTTMKERATYVGLTGLTWGAGTVLGPVIGGAFADSSATWRWAFYINLCIGALFSPVYLFLLPSADPRPGVPMVTRLKQIDFLGATLLIGATVAFIMALCFGGILYAWDSGRIIALWVVAGVLYILLGIQQVYCFLTTQQQRIFPVEFFTAKYNKELIILFCCIAAGATVAFTPIYMIPLYFQFTLADSALEAGVRLLPLIVTMVVFCILNGIVMSVTGYYMPWYVFGGALSLAGGALFFSLVDADTSTSKIYGYSVLLGIGSGSFIQAGFSVAQAIVEPHNVPSAVGFISQGQSTGVTICLAIINNVLITTAQRKLHVILPNLSPEEVQAAIAGVGSNIFDGLSGDKQHEVLEAIVQSISVTYGTVIAAGALTLVLGVFLSRKKVFMEPGAAS